MIRHELNYKKTGDRNLIILRGVPGVGKSSFVKEHQLEGYTISMDELRHTELSPVMSVEGFKVLDNTQDNYIYGLYNEQLNRRLSQGVFTVLDNTHLTLDSIRNAIQVGDKYGYDVSIINFEEEVDLILERNKGRYGTLKYFKDEKRLLRMYDTFEQNNERIKSKYPCVDSKDIKGVQELLGDTYEDLSNYREVKVIGDIHGSYTVLKEAIPEIEDDVFYIFLGDYVDRGTKNHEVLKYLEEICGLKNVVLLEGNHEIYLRAYINNIDLGYGREFKTYTLPELIENKTGVKSIRKVIQSLRSSYLFEYNNVKYVCTHGGILPTKVKQLRHDEKVSGVGGYDFNIDEQWNKLSEGDVQFHGHRNKYRVKPNQYKLSYNLESKVDSGGALRVATVNPEGVNVKEYVNYDVRNKDKSEFNKKELIKQYIQTVTEDRLGDRPRAVVREMPVKGATIRSVRFTSNYVNKGYLTDDTPLNVVRGLFVDEDNNIVMRGYNKYYNLGENADKETQIKSMVYPVVGYKKENGFLGLLSYDNERECFLYGTKGVVTETKKDEDRYLFVNEFIRLFEEAITETQKEYLKKYLIINKCTLTFEVISHRDKHITKEDKECIVLLDIIDNKLNQSIKSYTKLTKLYRNLTNISDSQYLKLKKKDNVFKDSKSLERMLKLDRDRGVIKHEGYVLVDESGDIIKYKSMTYGFWKVVRNSIARAKRNKGKQDQSSLSSIISRTNDFKGYRGVITHTSMCNYITDIQSAIVQNFDSILTDVEYEYTSLSKSRLIDVPKLKDRLEEEIEY